MANIRLLRMPCAASLESEWGEVCGFLSVKKPEGWKGPPGTFKECGDTAPANAKNKKTCSSPGMMTARLSQNPTSQRPAGIDFKVGSVGVCALSAPQEKKQGDSAYHLYCKTDFYPRNATGYNP